MSFFEVNKELMITILIPLGIVLLIGVVVIAIYKIAKANARNKKSKQDAADVVTDEELVQQQSNAIQMRDNCLVLARNVTYSVGADGEISAGKYIIKSAVSNERQFNIRFNGLVNKYSDGVTITLGAGDSICVVSTSVLLQPVSEN